MISPSCLWNTVNALMSKLTQNAPITLPASSRRNTVLDFSTLPPGSVVR